MSYLIIIAVASVIIAYLIGSINFAVIFANYFLKKDVRKLGSGNAGTTNVLREAGPLPGALTFICDVCKGALSSIIGRFVFKYITENSDFKWSAPIYGALLCGAFCMIGHIFPIFFQFKGGKGVAACLGVYAACYPLIMCIGLAVFIITVLVSKMVSLGSVLAVLSVMISTLFMYDHTALLLPQEILCVIMGMIVIIKHHSNIKRIINGNENKLKIGRR